MVKAHQRVSSPYEAALKADRDPDGDGWYIECYSILFATTEKSDVDRRIFDVHAFGPEWVLMSSADENIPPVWERWESIGPCAVILGGQVVGMDA